MGKPPRPLYRAPAGEFWLLAAVLMLLALIALLHLAVQRERNSGPTAIDVQTLSEIFTPPPDDAPLHTAGSPN